MRRLGIVLLMSCASTTPLPPLAVPAKPLPLEQLVQPPPPRVPIPQTLARYPDRALRPGECPGLPRGVLVSPGVYAAGFQDEAELGRLRIENLALRQLTEAERNGEQEFEASAVGRVHELEDRVASMERWGPWKVAGSIFLGAMGMMAATWAAGRAR